jgi:hypothetical protein
MKSELLSPYARIDKKRYSISKYSEVYRPINQENTFWVYFVLIAIFLIELALLYAKLRQ